MPILSDIVKIKRGGTGQTTKTEAFDALSPTTTQGDTIYHNGGDNVRLPKGTSEQYMSMDLSAIGPEWKKRDFLRTSLYDEWLWGSLTPIYAHADGSSVQMEGILIRGSSVDYSGADGGGSDSNGVYSFIRTTTVLNNGDSISAPGYQYEKFSRLANIRLLTGFKLIDTTDHRVFIGLHNNESTDLPTTDDYLNALSGVGLYVTSNGNFRFAHNDGSGATNFTSDIETIDSDYHTFYLEADNTNSRWGYSWDRGNMVWFTSEIPAESTMMHFVVAHSNAAAVATKQLNFYGTIGCMRGFGYQ